MSLSDIDSILTGTVESTVILTPFGTPITADEVSDRLSPSLYEQLSEGNADVTAAAISRAQVYVGAVLRRLRVPFDLDSTVVREIVLIHVIYELHIALGHEEAGREYRLKAKEIILAAYGEYPDAEKPAIPTPSGAVAKPRRHGFPR